MAPPPRAAASHHKEQPRHEPGRGRDGDERAGVLQYGAKTVTDEPMLMGLNGSLIGYARNHVKAIKSATKKKELLECIALMEKAEEENARA